MRVPRIFTRLSDVLGGSPTLGKTLGMCRVHAIRHDHWGIAQPPSVNSSNGWPLAFFLFLVGVLCGHKMIKIDEVRVSLIIVIDHR
jgi:hypothetical protein